jgi:hypothetical protein
VTPDVRSPVDPDVGYGEEPTDADVRLAESIRELSGPAALVRVAGNARATVGTIALVGTVLGALGLVSVPAIRTGEAARWLAIAAALMAIASVVSALLYLALRVQRLNIEDLEEVREWYRGQLDRVRFAVAASWLLLAAVLVAGLAAVMSLVHGPEPTAALSLQLSGQGDSRSLSTQVSVDGLSAGEAVTIHLVGLRSGACPDVVVLQASSTADSAGKAISSSGTVSSLPCNERFRLEVNHTDRVLGSVTVP